MAQSITWLGNTYPDCPAITLPKTGGGTARFTDATPTTAVENDVASGKIFVKADGSLGTGSATGGGGLTTEVSVPEQSVTANREDTSMTFDEAIIQNDWYLVTIDGTSKVCTGILMWGDVHLVYEYGKLHVMSPTNGSAVYLEISDSSYYGTYTVKVEKIVDGIPVFTTKTITTNGTYNASSDSADGYSSVTVNVSGGSSTLITKNITANGTYNASSDNADGYSSVTVAVSGSSKNVQVAAGVDRVATTSYTAVNGQEITVSTTGTYDVYWTGYRSSTSGTSGSCLYVDGTAHSSGNKTTFTNNGQSVHITGVSLTKNQVVTVRARARNTSSYMYVGNLTIVQTS